MEDALTQVGTFAGSVRKVQRGARSRLAELLINCARIGFNP